MPAIDPTGERIQAILELIYRLGEGNLSARGELTSAEDDLDAVMAGLNLLAEELEFAARARREAEQRLADEVDAYENAPAMFCSIEADTLRIVRCNAKLATTLGYDKKELAERTALDLHAPECRDAALDAFRALARGEAASDTQFELLRRDGTTRQVELIASLARGEPDRIRVIWRDVTEQRHLERQLTEAQKLQAVGQLAGGIAHDFNNLLTIIIGATDLALRTDPDKPLRADLVQIQRAARSGAELTRGLLAFSRRSVVQPRATTLPRIVFGAKTLISRLLDEDIKIAYADVGDPWTVLVDEAQFEQVLLNLAINARDAMPDGGVLTIETANVTLDPDYAATHSNVAFGEYAMLAVSDTGIGMDQKTVERAFEPFFTNKPRGKGTGLGLAVCYGLVQQAGGSIVLYSELGRGTTVKVYLPRSLATPEPAEQKPAHQPLGGARGTILVVEDEEAVRDLTVRVLRAAGFNVLEARDGIDAIELAQSHPDRIDMVVTDVIMPNMSGRELVDALRAKQLVRRVLYVSGYTENSIAHHGVLDEGVELLSKPFSPTALLERIHEVLSKDPPA